MRYWSATLISVTILMGCGGSDSSNIEIISDLIDVESIITEEVESIIESSEVNYSLISCEDDLVSVLTLINAKRAEAQVCGEDSFGPVAGVTWNSALTLATEEHSANMANYDFFAHTGLDGDTVATRVTDQGYSWSYVAENIATGQTSAEQVVDGWMSSDGHCRNIMNEDVTEMGLACVANSSASYPYYWTQVFASPL
ncbi:CAP domain-containing protein [Psychromonas sp. KJ10-10]|uniref:CAP domain-containing protein n=1 Tax=Psychromonas sp. KJ10-10 TaxID=3391823 RepID=UPI0039B5602A